MGSRGIPNMTPVVRRKSELSAIQACKACEQYQEPGWCKKQGAWCYVARKGCSLQSNK